LANDCSGSGRNVSGVLLAYGFVAPIANLMEERLEASGNAFKCAQKVCCVARKVYHPL